MADVLERLRYWRDLPHGAPLPEAMSWDVAIKAVCADAIAEIERLRKLSGPVDPQPSFRDITDKVHGRSS